jgi:hypothetical protein
VNASCPTCRASIFQSDVEVAAPARASGRVGTGRVAPVAPSAEALSERRVSDEEAEEDETARMVRRDLGEEEAKTGSGGRRQQQHHQGIEMYSSQYEV